METIHLLFLAIAALAVVAAFNVVLQRNPIYSAIGLIIVLCCLAGLFLTLYAQFIAAIQIIVYAGAILIVYMFVLMLAQQSPSDGDVEASTAYDRVPREPFAAVVVGFMLFASVGECFFVASPVLRQPADPAAVAAADLDAWNDLDTMPKLVERIVRDREPATISLVPYPDGRLVMPGTDGGASVKVTARTDEGVEETRTVALTPDDLPGNTQRLGLALVLGFPGGLELAGIILLMAMYGAVVLARKQIELGEDERRELAGLSRLALEESEPPARTGGRA